MDRSHYKMLEYRSNKLTYVFRKVSRIKKATLLGGLNFCTKVENLLVTT